jgi:hypothetical protein
MEWAGFWNDETGNFRGAFVVSDRARDGVGGGFGKGEGAICGGGQVVERGFRGVEEGFAGGAI